MIPTVPFSFLAGLLLGLLFAWSARNQFRDGRQPWGRELRAVVSYQVIIRWPLVTYFFIAHRQWTLMSSAPAAPAPVALLLLILPLDAAALIGGYAGGWWLLRRRGEAALRSALGAAAVFLLIFVLLARGRLFHDFDGAPPGALAGGRSIADIRLLWVLLVVTVGALVAAWEVQRTLVYESRRKARTDVVENRKKGDAG